MFYHIQISYIISVSNSAAKKQENGVLGM